MSDLHDNQRAAFDDDRLLDFALGLEDDPELAAALSHSARLRERLADLKSDLAAIDNELRSCIPPVDEAAWADPAAGRWSRLRGAFGLRPAARAIGLRRRRLATVLVAAALLVAVVIGTVVVLPRGSSSGSGAEKSSSGAAAPAAYGGAAGSAGPAVVATRAADYAVVAVVRAGPLRGASQSYTVVRRLKGRAPAVFTLVLQAIDTAPQAGSLAIAYLDPVAPMQLAPHSSSSTTSGEGMLPTTPSPARAAASPAPFTLDGRPALVTVLPVGASAAAVRLPR